MAVPARGGRPVANAIFEYVESCTTARAATARSGCSHPTNIRPSTTNNQPPELAQTRSNKTGLDQRGPSSRARATATLPL